jgi:putative DNA primase/helicase
LSPTTIPSSRFNDISGINNGLDAETVKIDDRNGTDAEIKRLARLSPIEYDRERMSAAERLGISLKALDAEVKAARAENGDTKGQGRPLELPVIEPWSEPVNGADLLDDICNAVKRYLVLPEGCAEVLALWALHTHAFECFGHSPRLAITSPEKRCGKTTTLDVMGELVARPLPTSNATTAAIFRTIEKAKPTLLIDEADTFLKDNEELRGILNAGHRRGGQIIRTVGEDYEPRQFSTWAPAAIAMIGRLPDTLEDRSVSIALRRRKSTERVQQFRSDRVQDLKQLARKSARWCDDNQKNLAASEPNTGALVNRSADNWRPLLAIADIAGGRWPEHARTIAEVAEMAKPDQSTRTMVLSDIRDFFAARPEVSRVASAELAGVLGAMENRPWSEWRNGKPITPAALARLLAPFGITPGTKRDGGDTFKGYLLSNFAEAFATYLPDQTVTPSQPSKDGHCDASQSVTTAKPVTLFKTSQPNNSWHCDGVTVGVGVDEEVSEWTL